MKFVQKNNENLVISSTAYTAAAFFKAPITVVHVCLQKTLLHSARAS